VGVKPRTTVSLTEKGLKRFDEYPVALSEVLKRAKHAMASDRKPSSLLQMAGILSPA
jgi:hypothetical protein